LRPPANSRRQELSRHKEEETEREAKFLAATTAIAIAISGGSAFAVEKKQLYFVPNGAVDFWKLAEAGMKKAQAELPNYSIQIKYPEQSSAAIQNRLMDDLVAGGAAGIMVSAIDPKTQTEALDKVASQAVLATTDSDAPASKRAFYLGSSNVEAGKQAAEVLIKAMPQAASASPSPACRTPTTHGSGWRAFGPLSRTRRSRSRTCAETTWIKPAPSATLKTC
jgi:ABC-type sugar transport system substrate-binding protein